MLTRRWPFKISLCSTSHGTDCNQTDSTWQDVLIYLCCCCFFQRWLMTVVFSANICTSVTTLRHPPHRGLAVTIQVQRGSPSVSPDASVPLVTVKAHSVTLPSNVFKAKHEPFRTDTCQNATLYIQTCLRRGSSEYSRFNTHNVSAAFPLTLKTPFHVSAAAANVIWCMITNVHLKCKCQKLWILYWFNLHGEHDLCLWLVCFLPVVVKTHPPRLHGT